MVRIAGFSGTVFRLQGGSLVDGEDAPFDHVVYRYSIVDGIRDGYLVPAFSVTTDDTMNVSKLKVAKGDFTGESQDVQMIAAIDNHVVQMLHHGRDRRAWLVFEASTKAAKAMTDRLNQWGVPSGLVLGETPAGERAATIAAYRAGRLKCLVNVAALTTGFDVQETDMLVMRRRTKSLGLYVQMTGRILRTIGGNIDASTRAGKPDSIVLDFAGNISAHGALDFIRPKESKVSLVSCDSCNKRNAAAAMRCWSCDEPMTKICPACLEPVQKGILDCPSCKYDMRTGGGDTERKPQALLETPSGAALISSFAKNVDREGGWAAVRKGYSTGEVDTADTRHALPATLLPFADKAKWLRVVDGDVVGILIPNGLSRTSVLQVGVDGVAMPVPMPSLVI